MRLALGTVQFGLPYGVANTRGQVTPEEAAAIITAARSAGCDTLDTAIAYGNSETVLGSIGVGGWRVITKLPAVPDDETDVEGWMRRAVEGSLSRLKLTSIYGVLLHRPAQLMTRRAAAIAEGLRRIRDSGLARKVGLSAVAAPDLDGVDSRCPLDVVQVPFNLFDRRLLDAGRLDRLVTAGTEVHVRSVFLQGLLLMEQGRRPPAFERWSGLWSLLEQWLLANRVTALQACIRDALSQPAIARVVVGVDSAAHWAEIVAAADGPASERPAAFDHVDGDLITPVAWTSYPPESLVPRT